MTKAPAPSLQYYLPYGELLRVFLDMGTITPKEIRAILRGRGIFLPDYEKQTAVPHLAFATVTPEEFSDLLESQKTKDESQKTSTVIVPWVSANTIEDSISKIGPIKELIEAHQTCKITRLSEPQMVGKDPNHFFVEVELEKHDLHKSWVNDTAPHLGRVAFQKIGEGKEAKISITSTISETKEVCKKIAKNVRDGFTLNGDVPAKQADKAVHFESFDNAQRVKFLMSLTSTDSLEFIFDSITDSEISPDNSTVLPAEIKPLLYKVRQMSMKGDALQDSPLLKESKYHQHIILSQIVVKYNFDYHAGKGSCVASFGFSGYPKNNGSACEFEVTHGQFSLATKGADRDAVKRHIRNLIDSLAFSKSHNMATEKVDVPKPVKATKVKTKRSTKKAMASPE